MNHLLTIALALSTPAHAGKLADGFRGIPYGPQSSPARIDGPCVADSEPGVPWSCASTVGEVPVSIAVLYEHGILWGWAISATGYTACDTLMDTLTAAYGPSRPAKDYAKGKLDDRRWGYIGVVAHWDYNQFSKRCQASLIDVDQMRAAEAAQAAQAAKGASDL